MEIEQKKDKHISKKQQLICDNGFEPPYKVDDEGKLQVDKSIEDLLKIISKATGTVQAMFGSLIWDKTLAASITSSGPNGKDIQANAIVSGLIELKPRNGLEGMLISQMIAVFAQGMECLRKANVENQPFEIKKTYRDQAIRLMKVYTTQMEALKKYRSGGKQKMVIEHVHIHKGGQAIVGSIAHGGGGGKVEK